MPEISIDQLLKITDGISVCSTEIKGLSSKVETLFVFHNDQVKVQNAFIISIQTAIAGFECSEKGRIDKFEGMVEALGKQIKGNTAVREDSEIIAAYKIRIRTNIITGVGFIAVILGIAWTTKKLGWW